MDTLTDRYVWAVTRGVPHDRRKDVGEQLRADVAANVAGRRAAGADARTAETAAITDLGDPDRRAAEASGRPGYLIGPAYFFDYRRILIIVLSAVTPSVFGALLLVEAMAGTDLWRALLSALTVAVTVAVQVAFWMTVAFAVIDRMSGGRRRTPTTWNPADLPELPMARVGLGETIFALLAYLLIIGLIVWQQNIWVVESAGGTAIPLLDPALWSFWLPWFIVLAVLEMAFALTLYAVGRWTWALAWVNVLLNLAFAVPAVMLVVTDQLLSAQFREVFADVMPLLEVFLRIIPYIIVGATVLDAVGGFRKAYRGRSPASVR
ncbi:hypothetical protein [Microbacterium sp. LWS13-1.2]|uniref:Uncharacterized protein n=1 Tax=Microbacterium sp. LWS13-1.2 TaxID=3135264 RepID=A0AAU6S830_9MICO